MTVPTIKDCSYCKHYDKATELYPCIECEFSKSDSPNIYKSCDGCSHDNTPSRFPPCCECEGSMWEGK